MSKPPDGDSQKTLTTPEGAWGDEDLPEYPDMRIIETEIAFKLIVNISYLTV